MMFHLLMRDSTFDPSRLRSLRSGIIAGGPVSEKLGRRHRAPRDVERMPGRAETRPTVSDVDFVIGQPHRPPGDARMVGRGPDVTLGARTPVETRRSSSPAGSCLTDDLGLIGAEGCARIVSRSRDTILGGGHWIHPREATGQLRAHPAVNDVCVIGIPHDVLGELVCARIAKVPDLVRFPATAPKSGAGRGKRRALERTFALGHTAIIGST
jgi:acyl-CoA synthetase (AMP-forming)/AMP-acid ligase II